jgi:hypothetical protein
MNKPTIEVSVPPKLWFGAHKMILIGKCEMVLFVFNLEAYSQERKLQ